MIMKKKLKPAGDLIVRDPATKLPLSKSGEMKELNTFWNRRIKDGDVEVVETVKKPASSSKISGKVDGKDE